MRPVLAVVLALCAAPAAAEERAFATFDGASRAVLSDPHDVDLGPDGRVYVADRFGNRIAVFDPETLEIVQVLGREMLPGVHDVDFGPDGRVAVAVSGANAVAVYADWAGIDRAPDALLRAPRTEGALVHSSGRVYAMASGPGIVMAYDGEELVAEAGGHFGAHDVAEAPDGTIWVADHRARRLVRYSPALERLAVLEGPEFGFVGPRYMDVLPSGLIVVADQEAHRILLIDPAAPEGGRVVGAIGDGRPGIGPGRFDDPEGVAYGGGRYFVVDSDNGRIVRYAAAP